ncbi:hypothetical protein TCAL_07237 [Tigriopus californicus]|uniref:Metaxin-2 n=1 Tax=Tigriopus californicus TaxID=6832 RepID=A0A553NTD4_TIGCA|nr:metaxin-2-like [Tigriopus californicus]TRY68683.1 hypothetical protein TCAL_07237 [Tigriopus californicus]
MSTAIAPGAVTEALQLEMGAKEPWPEDAEFYQPYELEQILLPDNANCLSVQAYLRMCDLNFNLRQRSNAEHMSPSGKVPFIRAGKFVIAEMDPIISFVEQKGITLTEHLDSSQKADMRAYMSLVSNVLGNAEAFVSWNDDTTLSEVTKKRYGSVYPWPLNSILSWQKRGQVMRRLKALNWSSKSMSDVLNEVENCCQALSERLDNQKYFFNNRPTELDAMVFGHLFSILTTPLPDNSMASIVRNYKNLLELCQNIDKEYFDRAHATPL